MKKEVGLVTGLALIINLPAVCKGSTIKIIRITIDLYIIHLPTTMPSSALHPWLKKKPKLFRFKSTDSAHWEYCLKVEKAQKKSTLGFHPETLHYPQPCHCNQFTRT